MDTEDDVAPARGLPRLRLGAVVALALGAAFIVWLVARDDSNSPTAESAGAVAASPATLRALARSAGHPVYWVGVRTGVRYELTRRPDGGVFIRYLPLGEAIGEREHTHLTVATYPQQDALASVRRAAEADGTVRLRLRAGGLAIYDRARPTNVYAAYPGEDVQVEIYDPAPGSARRLAARGRIQKIDKRRAPAPAKPARAVSISALRATARSARHAVYWLGPRRGRRYELSGSGTGRVYVRYLPPGVAVGSRRRTLTVASYPQAHALATLEASAQRAGSVRLRTPGGGVAVFDRQRPTNVYIAFPGANVQVELYDPKPSEARRLVVSGAVRAIAPR